MSWLDEQLKKDALIPSTEAPKVQATSLQPASSDYATRMGARPNPVQLPSADWATRMGSKPVPLTGGTNQQTPQEPDYSNVQGADLDNIYDYVNRAKANARKSIDDQIADARRRKSTEAFGNMAQVLGQALNLGIGQRKFDKITPSTKWDERVEQLKQLGTQYDKAYDDMALSQAINEQVRRANARQQQYNFYLQNKYNQEAQRQRHADTMDEISKRNEGNVGLADTKFEQQKELIAQRGAESRRTKATPSGGTGRSGGSGGGVKASVKGSDGTEWTRDTALSKDEMLKNMPEEYQKRTRGVVTTDFLGNQKTSKPEMSVPEAFYLAVKNGAIPGSQLSKMGFTNNGRSENKPTTIAPWNKKESPKRPW